MPLGLDRHRHEFNLGDSAELEAYVLEGDDVPVVPSDIASVEFNVEKPDNTETTGTGQIQGNGSGFYRYLETDQVGPYKVKATFTFLDGKVRTDYFTFSIIDPFNPPELTKTERIVQAAWRGFEDLFDSEYGGPWLRDMTKAYFNEDKIAELMSEAMLLINTYPPEDRRDYLQRWQSVLQIEEQQFQQVLALWKRQFYGFYHNKLLIGSKAGRLMGQSMRQRNAARGYW
jgi:hypothetical protein